MRIVKEQILDNDPVIISIDRIDIDEEANEIFDRDGYAVTIIGWINPGEGMENYVII